MLICNFEGVDTNLCETGSSFPYYYGMIFEVSLLNLFKILELL